MSKLAPEERELVIRIADDEEELTCTSSSPHWTRILQKLAGKIQAGPGEKLAVGVYRVKLPLNKVTLLGKKRMVTLTDEQRAKKSKWWFKTPISDGEFGT